MSCQRTFSTSRLTPCFQQHKRKVNEPLRRLLFSGISERRAAKLLRITRRTVTRKILFLEQQADLAQARMIGQFAGEQADGRISAIQFDEMETFERSKCLPLSIPLIVHPKSRKIMAFGVASMPAGGPLAKLSRRKYGPRKDERPKVARSLFRELKPVLNPQVEILSDQNPKYPSWIRGELPQAQHRTVKGQRGCVVGQGELKAVVFDPLFSLNHTAAMIRANTNRLFRRTWCTTKRADRLRARLAIYAQAHNESLTEKSSQSRLWPST